MGSIQNVTRYDFVYDPRRKLYEFGKGGTWKVAKCLVATDDCVVGGHYHKNKDEFFFLLYGNCHMTIDGVTEEMIAICSVEVKRNVMHEFALNKGAVLFCLASEEYDPNDDYK